MPWVIGIDEAGYGPNLGPLVQVAVAFRTMDLSCIWSKLADIVRRRVDGADDRVLIDDSKVVHNGPNGLASLELGALTPLHDGPSTLGEFLTQNSHSSESGSALDDIWFDPDERIPVWIDAASVLRFRGLFHEAMTNQGIRPPEYRIHVTPASKFNQAIEKHSSKAGALSDGVIRLVQQSIRMAADSESIHFVIDKHGGRNHYAAMVQTALPDRWIHIVQESPIVSEYRLVQNDRECHFRFCPRAEQASFPVALASMVAKYLRERFMRQFNAFWNKHVPDLRPTAGYPSDAKRYYAAIEPVMSKLGIAPEAIWRAR